MDRGGGNHPLDPRPRQTAGSSPMRLARTLFRSARALAALLLLTAFAMGGAADARHHLSERGCATDQHGREGHCVCAGLHAAPFASEAVEQATPVECAREFVPVALVLAPVVRAAQSAAPRAPPED